jgi:hypothetical protein
VAISGDYAYVATNDAGLRIINISNPQSLYEVGFCTVPGRAERVVISGNFAYVADYFTGIRVINIANPYSPYEVGFYDTPDWALGVAASGDNVYVADYGAGLQIVGFLGAGVSEREPLAADRFLPTASIVRGTLELPPAAHGERRVSDCLLDIGGREVMKLHPGPNDVSRLAPGVYYVRTAAIGERTAVRKVVIQR